MLDELREVALTVVVRDSPDFLQVRVDGLLERDAASRCCRSEELLVSW